MGFEEEEEEELSPLAEYRLGWEGIELAHDLHYAINHGRVPVELEDEFIALKVAWWAFEEKMGAWRSE